MPDPNASSCIYSITELGIFKDEKENIFKCYHIKTNFHLYSWYDLYDSMMLMLMLMLCYVMFICYEMEKRCCHIRSGVVRICCVRSGVIIIWEENEERAKKKVNKSTIKDVRNEIQLITRHDNGIEENRCSNVLIHSMKWNKHDKKLLQNTLNSIEIIEQK